MYEQGRYQSTGGGVSLNPNTGPKAPPQSEIAEVLTMQEKATHYLHHMLDTLEQKAQPVLMNVPQSPDKPTAMQSRSSAVATQIDGHTERIGVAIARIQSLIDRLAV